MSRTVFRSVALLGIATIACAVLANGCTVTTTGTQPEVGPDPSATTPATAVPVAVSTSDPAPPATLTIPPMPPPSTPGDWMKPNAKGKAVGEACSKPDDCKSGVCEGEGCDTGPKCVAADRMCTRDLVSFCGCDGKSFSSSGSCPGRPYKKKGSCN